MSETTARLALPLMAAGQAQKELVHNEALALLDLAAQAVVMAVGVDTPPVDPAVGQCWAVGSAPSGAWAGQAGAIAGWTAGGWRFVPARAGLAVWSLADGAVARLGPGGWLTGVVAGTRVVIDGVQVVGQQRPAIAEPGGGATVDAEARVVLGQLLATLRAHGLIAG